MISTYMERPESGKTIDVHSGSDVIYDTADGKFSPQIVLKYTRPAKGQFCLESLNVDVIPLRFFMKRQLASKPPIMIAVKTPKIIIYDESKHVNVDDVVNTCLSDMNAGFNRSKLFFDDEMIKKMYEPLLREALSRIADTYKNSR